MMHNMKQNTFNFPYSENYSRDNFIVGEVNKISYHAINSWPHWHDNGRFSRIRIIIGTKRSGKTHLSHIWSLKSGAQFVNINTMNIHTDIAENNCYIIEDIDKIDQNYHESLLHIINKITDYQSAYLLMTSSTDIGQMDVSLPDLYSRLRSMMAFIINAPDDEILRTILVKLASDRQIRLNDTVINYVLSRIPRDYESILKFIDSLDHYSLQHKKDITINVAREILK